MLCELYLACGSQICSVICVKYVYSTPCCLVDDSYSICGIVMCIHPPYGLVKYWTYVAYEPSLGGIFISGIYLAIICEIKVAVGCVLAHVSKNVGSHTYKRCLLYDLYLECVNHICSAIYVKYVNSAPCWMVDARDFICVYICIHTWCNSVSITSSWNNVII